MRDITNQDPRLKTQDSRVASHSSPPGLTGGPAFRLSGFLAFWLSGFLALWLSGFFLCPIAEADSSIKGAFSFSGFATGVGTRAMGMNGAFVAVSDDSSSAYWNPAGLTSSLYKELSFTRADLHDLDLITNNTFNISAPETGRGALSFGWNQLRYDFESWREEIYLVSYARTLMNVAGKSPLGSPSTRKKKENAIGSAGILPAGFNLSCGATFKYLRQTSKLEIKSPQPPLQGGVVGGLEGGVEGGTSQFCESKGMGLDLGLLARFRARDGRNRFSIGIAAQDVPTVVRWNSGDLETEEYIPYRYKAGCSFEPLPRLTIALDLVGEQNVNLKEIHFGVEHWIFPSPQAGMPVPRPITEKNLAIRGGIARQLSASERMTFAGGLGIRWASWQLDYAYLMDSNGLGDTRNRFSISVRF